MCSNPAQTVRLSLLGTLTDAYDEVNCNDKMQRVDFEFELLRRSQSTLRYVFYVYDPDNTAQGMCTLCLFLIYIFNKARLFLVLTPKITIFMYFECEKTSEINCILEICNHLQINLPLECKVSESLLVAFPIS